MRQDNHASLVGAVVFRPDQAARHGMKSHDLELRTAHHPNLRHLARLAQADHVEPHGRKVAKRTDTVYAGMKVLDFGEGECGAFVVDGWERSARMQIIRPPSRLTRGLSRTPRTKVKIAAFDANAERQNYGHRQTRST